MARATRIEVRSELRGWEMGSERVLTPSGIARCFEHMRWEMGRRAREMRPDPKLARLRGVVRAQTHEYLGQLAYPGAWHGVTALVATGRTSLTYGHEIRDDAGRLIARARTVIVLIGEDGAPTAVPPTLDIDLDIDGSLDAPESLDPPPLAPGSSLDCTMRTRTSDHDAFGHVNQARYLDYLDDARRAAKLQAFRRVTLAYEQETFGGTDLVISIGDADSEGVRPYVMRRATDDSIVNRGAFAP